MAAVVVNHNEHWDDNALTILCGHGSENMWKRQTLFGWTNPNCKSDAMSCSVVIKIKRRKYLKVFYCLYYMAQV